MRLIPPELHDAARVDGARPWQEFRYVFWPVTRRATGRAALAVSILSLGELSAGKIVSTPGCATWAQRVFEQMHYGVTNELAARCNLALLQGTCTAPRVPLPAGVSPSEQLRKLCEEGLCQRYATQPQAQKDDSPERRQLNHELAVISKLEFEVFF